jgi:hypothetical protein
MRVDDYTELAGVGEPACGSKKWWGWESRTPDTQFRNWKVIL